MFKFVFERQFFSFVSFVLSNLMRVVCWRGPQNQKWHSNTCIQPFEKTRELTFEFV